MSVRKASKHISPIMVERQAENVFESREIALRWLESPIKVLGGEAPSMLLGTPEGCKRVFHVLAKIETGDFS